MILYFLSLIYFFLPAYFVNMIPPLAKRANLFNFLDQPVDFEKKFFGQRIFGSHKTWRGVILGILVGILIVYFQDYLYRFSFIKRISLFDYQKINIFLFGFLISFGAILGDLFFAFIKRRLKLKPGAPFLPFDQTNYVLGAAVFLEPFLKLGISLWLSLFILTFFLHLIFNRLGYYLKLHSAKW